MKRRSDKFSTHTLRHTNCLRQRQMQNILLQAKKEFSSYSHSERLFTLFAMLCGFFITFEYAVIKPTSNSIFIAHYGVKLYPYAWLVALPLNFFIVTIYNRFLSRLGCFRMALCSVAVTMCISVVSALYVACCSPLSFLLYIWKDIYVLLMFQQLWSVIHTQIEMKRAKYLYGILFGVSGCGAVFGSMVPGFLAMRIGSESLLFMTVPLYLLFIRFYYSMLNQGNFLNHCDIETPCHHRISQGIQLIRSSIFLKFILLIVILMQLSATIMEFQFNTFLHIKLPLQDMRTQFYGRLWATVNTCKLCMQFFATFLLVQFLGLRRSHFVVPGVLFINSALSLLKPTFSVITYSFGVIKTFDYSIFNIIKEMLYIPLKIEEKFKAKAIIDVFAYRSAKSISAFFVIGMQYLYPSRVPYIFSLGPFVIFIIWIAAISLLTRDESFKKPIEA